MPLTARLESGQSSPSLSTGGGMTASVGVGATATGPDGVSAGGGGATTGVLFSGCGFCGPAADVVFVALFESEPPLKMMKATPTTIAVTTATMPIARARRRQ